MKSAAIRQAFLQYFAGQDHEVVPSSSLIPGSDPTLLFTNAGMVQFKDAFLGLEVRPYKRAASSQRCVRAGGKHNDLENVGYTARHHTFFEMLGNFSFGDYFKRDAIRFAWEFLTGELKLPPERLWVTVHVTDDEAAAIWIEEIGIDPSRFSRLDEDNFWQMGDTGPCGPSSEIFYDHGPSVPGGPPGSEGDHLDRYIEIWNLVFMQFERQAGGELKPLPKPSVDTGMGLERIAAVMQGVHSNYEIDLFQALIKAAAAVTGADNLQEQSLRVIADHIRSCGFLISDGVLPSNEGRGYVLRRIIRRALRHGHKLGAQGAFFHGLVPALVEQMGEAYPDLANNHGHIERVLLAEEEQFAKALDKGLAVLDGALAELQGRELSGELVFTLYDTYGFPMDLTADIARERGFSLDLAGFEARMQEQRARARASGAFKHDYTQQVLVDGETHFAGYESLEAAGTVAAILSGGARCESLAEGQEAAIVLDHTPFYAESGGQIGDTGYLETAGGARFEVRDCQKSGSVYLHLGQLLHGQLRVGEGVSTQVKPEVRRAIARNHSATHLLHAALREVLGAHVMQKGSLVDSERLRFDFAHYEAVTPAQLRAIEARVNEEILNNTQVMVESMGQAEAKSRGAMALFGEKYGDTVRVLTMGNGFSVELCGGTHVTRTGDIGLFKIISESGIAAGVRRIEAAAGSCAFELLDQARTTLQTLAASLKVPEAALVDRIESLLASNRQLERALASARAEAAVAAADDWLAEAVQAGPVRLLTKVVDDLDPKLLRDLADRLKQKLAPAAVVLGGRAEGRVALVAAVSKDAVNQVKAGDLLRFVTESAGGKGGGRPDMAQGSAPAGPELDRALAALAARLAGGSF